VIRFGYKTANDWQRAIENFRIDASQDSIKIVDGAIPLDLVDDFNDGVFGKPPWADSTDIGDFGEAPVETGGFLQFDYPAPSGQKRMEIALNSPRGGVECETRFIWDSLGSGNSGAHANEWGIALLQGTFIDPPTGSTDFNNRLLWELTFAPTPSSNILHILPVMVDGTGQKKAFNNGQWVNFPGLGIFGFPINPSSPMSGIPVTFTVTKGPGGGLTMKAIRNDDPGQVIFETTESPSLRALTGDIYLNVARSLFMNASRFRFDHFKLSGQPLVPPTGFLRLRDTFPQRIKATRYSLGGDVSQGGSVQVQFRAGNTVEEVEAAPFSDPLPLGSADIQSGSGKILETKITINRASPSPTVSGLDIDYDFDFLEEDRPIILSLNEVGRSRTALVSGINPSLAPLVGDKDPDTQWESVNNTDGFLAGVVVQFLDATGFLEERIVDTLILMNTNYRNAFIRLLDINQSVIKEMQPEFSGSDVLLNFEPISTAMILLSASTTNPSNQLKKLGEVYAGRLLSILPNFDRYEPKREIVDAGQLRTVGGKLIAFRGANKYASRWTITLVDSAKKDELETVFKQNALVTFYPEPKYRPRDIFDVAWKMEELPFAYTEPVKTAGHTVEGEMTEI
jgi:hypothetical protein